MVTKALLYITLVLMFIASCNGCAKLPKWAGGSDSEKDNNNDSNQPSGKITPCPFCGAPIRVTMKFRDQLTNSSNAVDKSVRIHAVQSPLINFLGRAVDKDPYLKFQATYFSKLGFFIDSVNGTKSGVGADGKYRYWKILAGHSEDTLEPTVLGVSSYIPLHNQIILFNYTTWDDSH